MAVVPGDGGVEVGDKGALNNNIYIYMFEFIEIYMCLCNYD